MRDPLQTAFEWLNVTCAGDRALCEDAHHVSLLQFLASCRDRCQHVARTRRSHWNRSLPLEKPAQDTMLEVRLPDHETNRTVRSGCDQDSVHKGHMIGNQQRRAIRGHMRRALNPNPKK